MMIRDVTRSIANSVEDYLNNTIKDSGDYTIDDIRLACQTTDVENLICDYANEGDE